MVYDYIGRDKNGICDANIHFYKHNEETIVDVIYFNLTQDAYYCKTIKIEDFCMELLLSVSFLREKVVTKILFEDIKSFVLEIVFGEIINEK
jgi:hypothetical protein